MSVVGRDWGRDWGRLEERELGGKRERSVSSDREREFHLFAPEVCLLPGGAQREVEARLTSQGPMQPSSWLKVYSKSHSLLTKSH